MSLLADHRQDSLLYGKSRGLIALYLRVIVRYVRVLVCVGAYMCLCKEGERRDFACTKAIF